MMYRFNVRSMERLGFSLDDYLTYTGPFYFKIPNNLLTYKQSVISMLLNRWLK